MLELENPSRQTKAEGPHAPLPEQPKDSLWVRHRATMGALT